MQGQPQDANQPQNERYTLAPVTLKIQDRSPMQQASMFSSPTDVHLLQPQNTVMVVGAYYLTFISSTLIMSYLNFYSVRNTLKKQFQIKIGYFGSCSKICPYCIYAIVKIL